MLAQIKHANSSSTSDLIEMTTTVTEGAKIHIYEDIEDIIHNIDLATYYKDIKYLERKISLIVNELPEESIPKHIYINDDGSSLVVYTKFVPETDCEMICENAGLLPLSLKMISKIPNTPEACPQLSIQMTLSRTKFGIICSEKNKANVNDKCINRIKNMAQKVNLKFYENIEQLRSTMNYGEHYNLVQNNTHIYISKKLACCSCFGPETIGNQEPDVLTQIYKNHQQKMRKAAEQRLTRLRIDTDILEQNLASLTYSQLHSSGILEILRQEQLIEKLKSSYFRFVEPKRGSIKLRPDILYTDLIKLWDMIKLNNTDEEFQKDLTNIELEKLPEIYVSYIFKEIFDSGQKIEEYLKIFSGTNIPPREPFPILYHQESTLEDVIFKLESIFPDLTVFSILQILKFFENIKAKVSDNIHKLTGSRVKFLHYSLKQPPQMLEDSIQIIKEDTPKLPIPNDNPTGPKNLPDPTTKKPTDGEVLIKKLTDYLDQAQMFNYPKSNYYYYREQENEIPRYNSRIRGSYINTERNVRTTTTPAPTTTTTTYLRPSNGNTKQSERPLNNPARNRHQRPYTRYTNKRKTTPRNRILYNIMNENGFGKDSHLTEEEYEAINQLDLQSFYIKPINGTQIPPTNYIFKRLKNRDKDSDDYLSVAELDNYNSLKNILGYYNTNIMTYLVGKYGKTQPGKLSLTEFYELSKRLEKALDEKNRKRYLSPLTTISTIAWTSTPAATTTTSAQTSTPFITTTTPSGTSTQNPPRISNNFTSTNTKSLPTSSTPWISNTDFIISTSSSTTTTPEENEKIFTPSSTAPPPSFTVPPNQNQRIDNISPEYQHIPPHKLLENYDIHDMINIPDDFDHGNFEIRTKRHVELSKQMNKLYDISTKYLAYKKNPYLFEETTMAAAEDKPEKENSNFSHTNRTNSNFIKARQKRNIFTPAFSWFTGLASKEDMTKISNDEKNIKANEDIFKNRIVNLTRSDNLFRNEIKNITIHISKLLNQSTDLSDSFMTMLNEEKEVDEKVTFIIKSLGKVVHLSISIENLIFHLTSLEEEITAHILNVNNIQLGVSILNDDLFTKIQAHGGKLTTATFNNVKYRVYFTRGTYQIQSTYKLITQNFIEYRIHTLPLVIGKHNGRPSILKFDAHPKIVMNNEREIIQFEELKLCDQHKMEYLCNVKDIQFRRQYDICEADVISKLYYGRPSDLSLCEEMVTYVDSILNHQEYRQNGKYIQLISDFPDVGHWRCENDTEDIHIEPLKLIFIKAKPDCILETSVYRIYVTNIVNSITIDPEFLYSHQDLIDEILIPTLQQYNFTQDLEEISNNILKASTRLTQEKKSISELALEEAHLHENDLGKLLLRPWTISRHTTAASSATVITIIIAISIVGILVLCCCCYLLSIICPILRCCLIPCKTLSIYLESRNKKAVYEDIKLTKTQYKKDTEYISTLQRWLKRNEERLNFDEIIMDDTHPGKFRLSGRDTDGVLFDTETFYVEDNKGLHKIGNMSQVPPKIRHDLIEIITTKRSAQQKRQQASKNFQQQHQPHQHQPRGSQTPRSTSFSDNTIYNDL